MVPQNSPNEKETRFTQFSLGIFGLILFFASLSLGRALGDLGWSTPRLVGASVGVVLFAASVVIAYPKVFTMLTQHKTLIFLAAQVALFIWSVIGSSIGLEIGTRILVRLNPDSGVRTREQFMDLRPAPFVDAPYFGEEFLSETRSGKGVTTPLGTRLVIPNDQQGKYINVSNGKRRTAFQPIEVKNKVYLFGGSTIFSGEVPDEYTIASRLQQLLNTKFADRFTVENYGSTSVTLAQQFERLRTLQLAPGDVVIFYDGVNDVTQAIYYGHPEGWIIGENRGLFADLNMFQKARLNIYNSFGGRSEFVNVFLYPYEPFARLQTFQTQMKENYYAGMVEANRYAESSSASFFHFLQPNIFTLSHLSEYEKSLLKKKFLIFPWA
ncbi:MAG: SGNH/GDSL hydrolase family protein [Chloroflexi bacterium]|nr:SGNH/GDSL hydrolase family protein [Chloroflexota bacterium]